MKSILLRHSFNKAWRNEMPPAASTVFGQGRLHAKNSENREWSSSVHTQRPDRNNRGYQAASTTARRRDIWAAADFGFEGRDARQPGCRKISPPLRSRWYQARKL